jgi:hypothetical protein
MTCNNLIKWNNNKWTNPWWVINLKLNKLSIKIYNYINYIKHIKHNSKTSYLKILIIIYIKHTHNLLLHYKIIHKNLINNKFIIYKLNIQL